MDGARRGKRGMRRRAIGVYDSRSFFKGRRDLSRYPMRSSWRAFESGSRAPALKTVAPIIARVSSGGSTRIRGLDPGSLRTGFGVIDFVSGELRLVAQGCIATSGGALADRLRIIHAQVSGLITQHAPQEIAVERVFLSKNADSALKLGQARGAALAAVPQAFAVHEYAPRAIKLAVVGVGGAEKAQVAHMVKQLLRLELRLGADAADALAIAICHAHSRKIVYA